MDLGLIIYIRGIQTKVGLVCRELSLADSPARPFCFAAALLLQQPTPHSIACRGQSSAPGCREQSVGQSCSNWHSCREQSLGSVLSAQCSVPSPCISACSSPWCAASCSEHGSRTQHAMGAAGRVAYGAGDAEQRPRRAELLLWGWRWEIGPEQVGSRG